MNPRMTESTVVYEFFVNKMGNKDSDSYIGDEGMIFYDPVRGDLRISNDVTPGGIPLLQALLAADAGGDTSNTSGGGSGGGGGGGSGGGGGGLPGANNATVVYNYTAMEAQGVINYGNVKSGFQGADHFGWIMLDGRAVSSLSTAQQGIAAALGWTTYIPDATNRLMKMTGATPGTLGGLGNNLNKLVDTDLPNKTISGRTDNAVFRAEDHAGATARFPGVWHRTGGPNVNGTDSRDTHDHAFTIDLNPGTQTSFNVENQYMALNTFVFLGL